MGAIFYLDRFACLHSFFNINELCPFVAWWKFIYYLRALCLIALYRAQKELGNKESVISLSPSAFACCGLLLIYCLFPAATDVYSYLRLNTGFVALSWRLVFLSTAQYDRIMMTANEMPLKLFIKLPMVSICFLLFRYWVCCYVFRLVCQKLTKWACKK